MVSPIHGGGRWRSWGESGLAVEIEPKHHQGEQDNGKTDAQGESFDCAGTLPLILDQVIHRRC